MTNNMQFKASYLSVLVKQLVVVFFLLAAFQSIAYSNNSTTPELSQQDVRALIKSVRTDKLDYLQNKKQITQAYEQSKLKQNDALHLEAAAIYAELLFREEKYEKLNKHLTVYLSNQQLSKQPDVLLLFLESQLKLLSLQKELQKANDVVNQLKTRFSQSTPAEKIIILRAFAYFYTETDELKKTLSVALDGLELAMQNNDIASQGYFYRKIADAYNYLENKEKAITYAKKALIAYQQTQDGLYTAKAYWSLGNVLLEINKPNESLIYLDKALSYFESVNMQKGLSFAQYSIANILYKQENYEDALALATKNIEVAHLAGIGDMKLASMILMLDIYKKQGLLEKADKMNDEVFSMIDDFSRSIYKADYLQKRYQLKRSLNKTDDAFDAMEQMLTFMKKHYEATSETNIKTLQIKFEVKEKEEKILQLEYDKNINELLAKEEYQQKIIWRLSATIAFILVIMSLLLIYKQVLQRKKYYNIALTDYLTSSLNRRGIMQKAAQKLKQSNATIAIVDLDLFKHINDTYGHDVGDSVLKAFARAAQNTLAGDDQFGRYGGEEWLFVLNTVDKQSVKTTFDSIANTLIDICSEIEGLNNTETITFSAGAAISSSSNRSLEKLIIHADELLYKAKQSGRNQVNVEQP
ncbi:hypothetical protein PMAN_b0382 [Pseudoalteromonas marina]|uniref:tetratricopeptide repeat-containing diguanylate cyclase n=1 Tax=Pseudoalteromonas marina TaxID=267375 RepID=UPI00026D0BFB|nr:tetratricopeptide repeat-containing diguanylate cyclase [Pseudoalteromonas marina]KAF7772771.1 hypothetical protein PMAN_b0382 [Pseudoalteromonas marina]